MKLLIFGITAVFLTILLSVNPSQAVNRVLALDGDGDYVDCGNDASLDAESEGSISFWYYAHRAPGGFVCRVIAPGWLNARMIIAISGEIVLWSFSDGLNWTWGCEPIETVTLDTWTHLALTWDGSNVVAYKNGIKVNSCPQSVTPEVTGVNLWIGQNLAFGEYQYFDGLIDEVSIWNKALIQEEIQTTMNEKLNGNEEGLVGYWNFDNGTANDLSAYGNHGTLIGDAKIIPSINRTVVFDGDGDYVQVSDDTVIQDIFDGGGSVSCWIYPRSDGESNLGYVMSKDLPDPGTGWIINGAFEVAGAMNLAFVKRFSSTLGRWQTTNKDITLNAWNHVVIVYDSNSVSNDPAIYVNGNSVAVTEVAAPVGTSNSDASKNLHIGNNARRSAAFDGFIDEVRIWNRALTRMEIYAQKDAILNGDEPGLVGYWRLDEPPGSTIAYDSSENGNNGTLYGDADFVTPDTTIINTGAFVRIQNYRGSPGQTVLVPVIVENVIGIGSIDLTINYDPDIFTPKDAQTTNLTADWEIDSYVTTPGTFKVTIAHHTQFAADGAVIDIPFTVSPNAQPDSYTLTLAEARINEGNIDSYLSSGTFEVDATNITLTAPNGGEILKGGSSYNITWSTEGTGIDHIHLRYSTDSGTNYQDIIANTTNSGAYEWNPIPSIDSATVRIKAIAEDASNNALAEDTSDADFIIDTHLCVRPGDTNNDGKVDQTDVLPLGLHWARTGPARQGAPSCLWECQTVDPWNPETAAFADANGDGIVNQADVLCIGLNWGLTHDVGSLAPVFLPQSGDKVQASVIKPIVIQYPVKNQFTVGIKVEQVSNLFGVAFALKYTTENAIKPLSVEAADFLGSDVVSCHNVDESKGTVRIGISRKCPQSGVSGSGIVAKITFQSDFYLPAVRMTIGEITATDSGGRTIISGGTLDARRDSEWLLRLPQMPGVSRLFQNFPNPFNPETWIPFQLADDAHVTISIYDASGKVIRVIDLGEQPAGFYTSKETAAYWDGRNTNGEVVASGVYFYAIRAGKLFATKKMIILR